MTARVDVRTEEARRLPPGQIVTRKWPVLHYGTVPVVRATGGLDDTIDEETGFKFSEYSGRALLEAVRAAVSAFADPIRWQQMMRRGMGRDFSWKTSAAAYSELYRQLLGR